MIPFVDLKAQYLSIKEEIDAAIHRVIMNASFIGGEEVRRFEEHFGAWLGINYFIGCANGTDSIEILLKAMGIGAGDEVIVPALSWISTSEAVSTVGATPVFVDIHPEYYTINEELIEQAITPKTKAIIPVHLYGQPCDMIRIMRIANKYGLKVLEDCAQAHGATLDGQKVGTFGHCSSFSFFPGKNLGAYGDAGGMATSDPDLARTARMIANHGQLKKHKHLIEGRNSRLDGLQAAVLDVKLQYLDQWVEKRRIAAQQYGSLLSSNKKITLPAPRPGGEHAFHLYVVQIDTRNKVKEYLTNSGIECAIHYPNALPFLDCYANGVYSSNQFKSVTLILDNILSLPIYPEIEPEQLSYINTMIHEALEV
jgi:dTDP-4-amino-4,6-dideoxygalactose transaminase